MLLLEVDHLSIVAETRRSFLGPHRSVRILHNISFGMEAGESLALVGKSGSGKTTLARAIAGLVPPHRGTIHVNGVPVAQARHPSGASEVQLLFQNHSASINPFATVATTLQEGFEAAGGAASSVGVLSLLASVGLAGLSPSQRTSALSGGERQRIALARLLAAQPRVLIADEPTSALDRLTGDGVLDVLQDTCRTHGVALLHVTHDLSAARRTARRVLVLHEGGLVADGTWHELSRPPQHPATGILFSAAGLTRRRPEPNNHPGTNR